MPKTKEEREADLEADLKRFQKISVWIGTFSAALLFMKSAKAINKEATATVNKPIGWMNRLLDWVPFVDPEIPTLKDFSDAEAILAGGAPEEIGNVIASALLKEDRWMVLAAAGLASAVMYGVFETKMMENIPQAIGSLTGSMSPTNIMPGG